MGDVFNNTGYPFIDADNGGDIDGMIAFCENVLAEIDEDTIVIPGHGPVTRTAEMRRYVEILKTTRNRIKAMIDDGMSLQEIIAAAPTAEFDEELGAGASNVAIYVDRVYASLTK
jgi:glyoxylase-like metal-dependent hydrolase (beta-lactamase superfamily II)